jgi:hypothetical protein
VDKQRKRRLFRALMTNQGFSRTIKAQSRGDSP